MSIIAGLLIGIVVFAALLGIGYVVLVTLEARAVERRRHAALIRRQRAEARIQAATAQTLQQMLELARQIQDAERRS